ncbi:hypothetical protein ACSBR1_029858 [Camellia fascicularis]
MQRTNVVALLSSSDVLSCSNTQNGPSIEKVNPAGDSGTSGRFESASQASAPSTLNAILIEHSEALLIGYSAENFKKSEGLTSGPGKKGCKRRGWNRGTSGRFVSASWASSTLSAISIKQCKTLLKKLMQHQYGWVFNTPVDVVKLNIPDYLTVIKHPMDLGTIKSKIASSEYSSALEFVADVRLTFSNAMTYNPPGNDFHIIADTLSKFFEARWKVIANKLPKDSQPLPEKSDLSRDFEALLGELPDNIFEFVRDQISNGWEAREDEIEVYIDDLSDNTLFMLRKLLDDYLREIRKNQAKAKPCEIEVLNGSWLSDLSMQFLCKGY